jgi:benzodiazapine receptor
MALMKLAACILACLAAGWIGSVFTTHSISTWYAGLAKPSFTPPNWVFAPVWTLLYVLMGISLFLVWRKAPASSGTFIGLVLFLIQLGLNVLWSVLFFGLRSQVLGLADILLLWLAILATMLLFFRIDVTAGVLLAPYLLWVSFASALNFAIWRLNP